MSFRFRLKLRKDLAGLPYGRVKVWNHFVVSDVARRHRPHRPKGDGAGEPVTPRRLSFLSGGAGAELIFDD